MECFGANRFLNGFKTSFIKGYHKPWLSRSIYYCSYFVKWIWYVNAF